MKWNAQAGAFAGRPLASRTARAICVRGLARGLAAAASCALVGTAGAAGSGFTDVTGMAGVSYVQHVLDQSNCLLGGTTTCAPEANTGGAAVADVNEDGWPDLFVTRLHDTDILFCNDRDGTFSDCTAGTGLADVVRHSNGAGFADLDNDGDLDLMLLGVGDPQFFLLVNDGSGRFSEEAQARGVAVDAAEALGRAGSSVGFGDYDRDGYLDMYTTEWRNAGTGSVVPEGTPSHSRLLHNLGAARPGYFEDVTAAAGVVLEAGGAQQGYSVGFSVAFSDFDGDGWPDLAVTCDYNSSRLYWNNRDGTFSDGTADAGVATDYNGMGSSFGDVDGDGDQDWFVTSIYGGMTTSGQGSGNRLYINEGGRVFRDGTDDWGVRDGHWGWGSAFFDYDHDGDLDILHTNGYTYVNSPWVDDPIHLYASDLANGGTETMTDVAVAEGIADPIDGRGLVLLDYDRDGDMDVFVVGNQTTPVLYRNDLDPASAPGADWLQVRVLGPPGTNRDGFGAVVRVTRTQGEAVLVREIGVESQFLGHGERIAHFGLADAGDSVHAVEVVWMDGSSETRSDVPVNQVLTLPEPHPLTLAALGVITLGILRTHARGYRGRR